MDREDFSDERTFEEKPENNKRGNENVGRMTFWVGVAVSAEVWGQDRVWQKQRGGLDIGNRVSEGNNG